jgi:hypothetical protein
MLLTILVIILIVALIGGLPATGLYTGPGGYWPSGIAGLLLVVLLIAFLLGRI